MNQAFEIHRKSLDNYHVEFPSQSSYNSSELSQIYQELRKIFELNSPKTPKTKREQSRRYRTNGNNR